MQVGDIETDPDGSEWVIVSLGGAVIKPSRLRRNSLAHHIHAQSSPTLAASLEKEVDESAATSEKSPDPAG
jgi:hypothetical protein